MEVKSNLGDISADAQAIIAALKDTKKEVAEVGEATKKSSKGFKLMGRAVKGMAKAFAAAGLGLIVAGFLALKEAFQRNQKAMDLMETVLSTVSTTFNQLVTVLTDVVKWVTESTDRFDGLGKVLSALVTLSLAPIIGSFYALKLGVQEVQLAFERWLGGADPEIMAELQAGIKATKDALAETATEAITAGKEIGDNIGDAIGEIGAIYGKAAEGVTKISVKSNFEQAKATVAATKAAKFAAAEFAKLNAAKLKEAELFRQIRDDETKTFAERIQANKDLKKSLEEQQKLQSEQIQKQVTAAELAVQQNANDENKLALMEAQNAQLELEEAITGQLSEQKTNAVGLDKELLEIQKELRAEGLSGLERELQELEDSYQAKLEMADKAGVDTAAITAQYEKEKTGIIDEEAQKQKDIDKAVQDARVGMAKSGLALVSSIAGEGTAIAKGAAVASATISGVEGVQNAFTTAQKSPLTAVMPAYPFIQAGLAGAFSAIQIQKILSGSPAGGGGGGGGGASSATQQSPAPQMMSGAFDISGGVEPEPTKAFVVTDEMSNSQNQLANIRRRATI